MAPRGRPCFGAPFRHQLAQCHFDLFLELGTGFRLLAKDIEQFRLQPLECRLVVVEREFGANLLLRLVDIVAQSFERRALLVEREFLHDAVDLLLQRGAQLAVILGQLRDQPAERRALLIERKLAEETLSLRRELRLHGFPQRPE